ncbi:ABC transporter ATP-binding protein [Eisenibacter elegans]|jgi:putative ABC transport system ATP-binding protein|uniref:ABC transporter ATP-binding protein n=1 Tax=Eisenibacter elegans TaxID=997 RepID=UPI0003F9FF38|nr:ABC transporter ATP-binding protein [Eisenibacter elegans]
MSYLIQLSEVSKIFNAQQPNEVRAVQEVSLQLSAGVCAVLQGASGSGKTTLLTLIGCLSKPSLGRYQCMGEEVSRWSEKFLTQFRRRHIGMIFQHFNLVQGMDVQTNIALPLLPNRPSLKELRRQVQQAAEQANIAHKLAAEVSRLSGGEMQRVAIARALVNSPSLLIADEPTAHLDQANAQAILTLFAALKAQGKTILLTTHDPAVVRHPLVDQVLTMRDGRLIDGV